MDPDVVVVGAGPTGLTLACGLAAAGVAVRVLDAAAGPATTSRGMGLQPRGVEVLDRLGALTGLSDRGLIDWQLAVTVNGRASVQHAHIGSAQSNAPAARLIPQVDVEVALRDRLVRLGGSVEWGHGVGIVDTGPDDAGVRLDDGEEIRAGWVLGADGAHSAVRKAAGIGFPGAPVLAQVYLADVHADLDLPRDTVHTWLRRGTTGFIVFPLPGEDLWRVIGPAPDGCPEDPGVDGILAHLADRLTTEVDGTIHAVDWTSSFRIRSRLADEYRHGRVFLAGDAAHINSPLGGQGLNTGIGDAENLAWKLALVIAGRAEDALLDTYQAERRPVAADMLRSTSGATALALGDHRVGRLLRDRVAVPLLNRRWLQRRVARGMSQLDTSYRRGPLGSARRRWIPGLRPGDRVPSRLCTRADGTTAWLHSALGPQWALLGPEPLAAIVREHLGDNGVVRFTGGSDALLVRPDGHLGWRGSDPANLTLWLDAVLGRRVGARRMA